MVPSVEVRCLPLNRSPIAGEGSCDAGHMIEAHQPGLWMADYGRKGRRNWLIRKELALLDLCLSLWGFCESSLQRGANVRSRERVFPLLWAPGSWLPLAPAAPVLSLPPTLWPGPSSTPHPAVWVAGIPLLYLLRAGGGVLATTTNSGLLVPTLQPRYWGDLDSQSWFSCFDVV